MLREMVCMGIFLFALAGMAGSMVIVQRSAVKQMENTVRIMEIANEID